MSYQVHGVPSKRTAIGVETSYCIPGELACQRGNRSPSPEHHQRSAVPPGLRDSGTFHRPAPSTKVLGYYRKPLRGKTVPGAKSVPAPVGACPPGKRRTQAHSSDLRLDAWRASIDRKMSPIPRCERFRQRGPSGSAVAPGVCLGGRSRPLAHGHWRPACLDPMGYRTVH